jgi:uncharacterized protein (DUF58 family)
MDQDFLEPGDYELMKRMRLSVRRPIAGFATGEQRSPVKGGGIEFADYREYIPGDDIRQVDWSVFLRFRKLLVKLCAEEKELTLMTIIDSTRSMNFGNPDKLGTAKRIAAIISGIALENGNRAGVAVLGPRLREPVRPERNRVALSSLLRAIGSIEPLASAEPVACLREFADRYGGKCVAVLVSDLLYPEWREVVGALASSRCESHVVQVLAPEELDPALSGEVTLVDLEDSSEVSLHLDVDTSRRYVETLDAFLLEAERLCRTRGLGYSLVATGTPMTRVFHRDLVAGGLLC